VRIVLTVNGPCGGRVNRHGISGLREIAIVGVAAAIGNAIYHATGKRLRDRPITIDKFAAVNAEASRFRGKDAKIGGSRKKPR
jgi:CO/xanthine dehydrogenase Mo-binding subunit